MDLQVEIRATAVLAFLRNAEKRIPYVIANSLNATARSIQREQRAGARGRLRVRKETFIMRQISVISRGDFADPRLHKYAVRLHVGQKERLLLSELEKGGTRKPFGGGRRVGVPLTGGPARPSFGLPVQPGFTIKSLRLVKIQAGQVQKTKKGRSKRKRRDVQFAAHTTATGKIQIKGARRTFVLKSTARAPQGGIYQRVGPGRDDIRLVYSLVQSPALKALLEWVRTAERTASVQFRLELRAQIRQTLVRRISRTVATLA